ncbi:MAG: hypothetical protein WEF50_03640 [Myxococcota bacterium]
MSLARACGGSAITRACRVPPVAIVYYDPARPLEAQPGFRAGQAGIVDFTLDDPAQARLARVAIPPNACHALVGLGVVSRLNLLPLEVGPIAHGREAVLFPSALERAIEILYAFENELWSGERDFGSVELVVERRAGDPVVEYRLRFDRREFERSLLRLIDLFHAAWRAGRGVRLAL